MEKIAVFPGSFDPFTIGHESIVKRALSRAIAQVNKQMMPEIDSVFLLTYPEYTPVTSSLVRDIILLGGDASKFLPNSPDLKKFRIEDFTDNE